MNWSRLVIRKRLCLDCTQLLIDGKVKLVWYPLVSANQKKPTFKSTFFSLVTCL